MSIKELLKKCNLKLIFLPITGKGYFLRTPKKDLLVVSDSLTDEEAEKVVLHELGHALVDKETESNYRHSYRSHLASERDANDYMVHEMVAKYVALGNEAEQANYINLALYLGIDDFRRVKKELMQLCKK